MDLLEQSNQLAAKLANTLKKELFEEENDDKKDLPSQTKKVLAIYTAKFQTFSKGNLEIYRTLVHKFTRDDVYLATIRRTNFETLDLTFQQQRMMIEKMTGIDSTKIVEVSNSYFPEEILKKFDPKKTAFVIVVTPREATRLMDNKYFHRYTNGMPMEGYDKAGYFLAVPEIKLWVGKEPLSDDKTIKILKSKDVNDDVKKNLFQKVFGKYDEDMFKSLTTPIHKEKEPLEKTPEPKEKDLKQTEKEPKSSSPSSKKGDNKKIENPMDKKITNPKTGNYIQVKSALKYPRWTPVYKKAERLTKLAGVDRSNRVEDPEVNRRYRSRQKDTKKEGVIIDINKLLVEVENNFKFNQENQSIGVVRYVLEENNKKPVVIYGGRFQPFHAGHYYAYKDLIDKFGKDNVYIATSDKTDAGKSPFNFNDKKEIITTMFDVDPSKVIKVNSPYQAEEITEKLPSDQPVIWALGEKDADRLKNSKYFQPYNGNVSSGYKEKGYIMTVPQLPLKINNETISGTVVRNVFNSGSEQQKKKLFELLYGKFNPKIFDLINHKIKNSSLEFDKKINVKQNKEKQKVALSKFLKDKIKNPKTGNLIQISTAMDPKHPAHKNAVNYLKSKNVMVEGLLFEGGAYGHLLHPYEDLDLSFGDLRELVRKALGTGLDKEGPVTEKTDGQNIMFTIKDGKIRFARSIRHLKNNGQEAMTTDQLMQMFSGRGNLENTFGRAAEDLQSAMSKISPELNKKVFSGGKKFMSAEIIHSNSENVIPYGKNMLVLHHTVEFDQTGNPIKTNSDDGEEISTALKNSQADQQKEYGIRGQKLIVFSDKEDDDFKKKIQKYDFEINEIENKNGLSDKDTLFDYKKKYWLHKFDTLHIPLTNNDKNILIDRWVGGKKLNKLSQLSNEKAISWAKSVETNLPSYDYDLMKPLQLLIAKLGADSIARSTDLLSSNNPLAGKEIKQKLYQAVDQIKKSGDVDKVSDLNKFMDTLSAIGTNKISPTEGMIFTFKGKLYKFTGAFAPINRIIGSIKYDKKVSNQEKHLPDRGSETQPASSEEDKQKIKMAYQTREKEKNKIKDLLNKKVKNPETNNDILVKTALSYDKNSPAYKAAERLVKRG